ncbi:MAG: type III-A CRISPR-associated protein Csm2 [candidate division WOR-3 bacterium]|uniref:CRISPR system Cms protein Csm2 n=1 Tax=candidate division WOR-3 bacterium TaxID=2052148 RepID=A0A7C4VZE8_UNCW3
MEIREDKLRKIIKEGNAEELNNYAEELGKIFKELSTSQIRNILDEIQRISPQDKIENIKNKLHLLRPKLAYAAGRHKGRLKEFREVVEKAITYIQDPIHFKNFRNFIEAIVAYHRYYGGELRRLKW